MFAGFPDNLAMDDTIIEAKGQRYLQCGVNFVREKRKKEFASGSTASILPFSGWLLPFS